MMICKSYKQSIKLKEIKNWEIQQVVSAMVRYYMTIKPHLRNLCGEISKRVLGNAPKESSFHIRISMFDVLPCATLAKSHFSVQKICFSDV